MNREDENKDQQAAQQSQQSAANNPQQRQVDDDQPSYPGKLDHVEGRMNNGELGGGLRKEEE